LSSNIITNSDYAINLNSGANTLSLTGVFSATGNIAGNFFIGNGSQLTGVAASYGNSNVVANLAALGTNPVSTTGNITSSFFIGNGSQLTGLAATYGNSNVVANLAALGTNPVSTTGNITGGNLLFGSGLVSGTGTVSTTTLSATGAVTFSGTTTNQSIGTSQSTGTLTLGAVAQTGAINIGRSLANQTIAIGNGATISDRIKTIDIGTLGAANSTTNINIGPVAGNSTVQFLGNAQVAIANTGGSALSVAGNITGGNILGGANVNATTHTGTTVSVSANITGGNLLTGGLISATGNVVIADRQLTIGGTFTSYAVAGRGIVAINGSTSAMIDFANGVSSHGYLYHSGTDMSLYNNRTTGSLIFATNNIVRLNISSTGIVSVTGNIQGGNLLTAGLISATGDITGGNLITGGIISATGNITGGNISTSGNIIQTNPLASISTSGNISAAGLMSTIGNISGGNIAVVGLVSAGGNVIGGNILTGGLVSATGNIFGDNLTIAGNTATITTASYSIGYLNVPQVSLAANATTALTDSGKHYYSTSASNLTLTVADNSAVSWPVGTSFIVVNRGTGNITVAPAAGVSLYLAGNSTSANRVLTTYNLATCLNLAANVWMISGSGLV